MAICALTSIRSTGEPKAVLTEHRAGSTSAIEHGTVEGVEPYSRVLQFASYTFDVSTSETLTTLIRGGTVCIPSESDRLEHLAEVINRMNINHTFLTRMYSLGQLFRVQVILTITSHGG